MRDAMRGRSPSPNVVAYYREDSKKSLIVKDVDFCIEENARAHETHHYDITQRGSRTGIGSGRDARLVVRRGEPFKLKIRFQRDYRPDVDVLNLTFSVSDVVSPNYAERTQVIVPVVDENFNDLNTIVVLNPSEESWYAKLASHSDRHVLVYVTPSSDAIVGQWLLEVDTSVRGDRESLNSHKASEEIYILFNPWWIRKLTISDDAQHFKNPINSHFRSQCRRCSLSSKSGRTTRIRSQ